MTRYLAQFQTPREVWAAINEKHVMDVTIASEGLLLQNSATRPKAHRYRYPQWVHFICGWLARCLTSYLCESRRLDFVSPHLAAVGSDVDMSGVVAKGSHE